MKCSPLVVGSAAVGEVTGAALGVGERRAAELGVGERRADLARGASSKVSCCSLPEGAAVIAEEAIAKESS